MKKPSMNKVMKNSDRLVIIAVLLSIAGMGMCLPLFFKTTGLALFLFMVPGMFGVAAGVLLYSVVAVLHYKRRVTFFKQDSFLAGTTIFQPGEPGEEVFLVKSGQVEIFETRNGEKQNVREVKEGDHFGEIAIFEKRRRKAFAVAKSDVEVVVISQNDFEALVRNFPEVRENFVKIFGKLSQTKTA